MREWLARTLKSFAQGYRLLLTLLLLNAPVVALILSRNLDGVDFGGLSLFYAACVILGYYLLILFVLTTLVHVLLWFAGRAALAVSAVLITIVVFYLLVDTFVYDLVKFHVDLFWLDYILHDYEGLGLPASNLYTAGAGLLLTAAVEIGLVLAARRLRIRRLWLALLPVVLIATFAASQVLHIVAYQRNDGRITRLTPHFPLYVPTTSHKNAMKYGDLLPLGEESAGLEAGGDVSLDYPRGEIDWTPPSGRPPNMVFIMLESWRWDAMDAELTPNIYALAERSAVFTNHLSSGNQTTCGIFGLFYGLHATYWPAVKANSVALDNPVLMDVMKDCGYSCSVFARSKFERHKIRDTMFRGMPLFEAFRGGVVQDHDVELNDLAKAFITENADEGLPFMLYAFYKSSHFNYCYPARYRIHRPSRNMRMAFVDADTDPTPYLNDYRNGVHYCDALVGDLLRTLEETGQMENTVIVVTTDHGEAFNDTHDNTWGHGSTYTQYQTRVPLILHLPGRAPETVTRRTAHIDLVPTLMEEVFGCTSEPSLYSNGRNLFDPTDEIRPLVIGSYFNHAFVIGDNVYEIFPMFTRRYRLDDASAEAAPAPAALMRRVMEEMKCFQSDGDAPGVIH